MRERSESVVSPLQHGQYGLKHLFGLMTISAGAAALVAWFGPGTLMTSAGVLLAWLNLCGAFEGLQTPQRQATLLWIAWALFLISLALPSMMVFGPVLGWGAAWFVLTAPLEAIREGNALDPQLAWVLWLNVANLLGALLPVLIWRRSRGGGQWMTAALCIAMVSTWIVVWDSRMLPGYYVWCASFLLALIAMPMQTKTFVAMLVAVALLAAMAAWSP